jgi:diacylglycerol kinase (ATP)
MAFQGTGDFRRLIRALTCSLHGVLAVFKSEVAFRQEVFLAVILIPLGFWLGDNGAERALLIGSILFVMIIELINSGIEAVVDRFGREHHELSGRAKDAGSAAVLFALINTAIIWTLILVL